MAIYLKTFEEIELLREVGHIVGATFKEVSLYIKPGVTLFQLDKIAGQFIKKSGAFPSLQKREDLSSFWSIKARVNDSFLDENIYEDTVLLSGDVVNIECGVKKWGFNAKACYSFAVGNISLYASQLIAETKKSLDLGISNLKVGLRTGDVASAIMKGTQAQGYSLLGDTLGHGIGRELKEDPIISSFKPKGKGEMIKVGMAFALGVKILGKQEVSLEKGKKEKPLVSELLHTIIIGPKGAEVLTL